jgi:hypothetical protein
MPPAPASSGAGDNPPDTNIETRTLPEVDGAGTHTGLVFLSVKHLQNSSHEPDRITGTHPIL